MLTLGIDTSNYATSLAVFDTNAGECDVILADHQQADRAVDAAVEGEVGFL